MKDEGKIRRFRIVMVSHPKNEAKTDPFEYYEDVACTTRVWHIPRPKRGEETVWECFAKNVSGELVSSINVESEDAEAYVQPSQSWVEADGVIKLTFTFTEKFVPSIKPPESFITFEVRDA